MSNREICINIINAIPEEQLKTVIPILQTAKSFIDEVMDDAFCHALLERYERNPDNEPGIPIEEFAAQLGIVLE